MKQVKKISIAYLLVIFILSFLVLDPGALAASPTPSSKPTVTPSATPSTKPTDSEEEKVQEIRDAIKEKVNEIKDKIERKAYVGVISQITDSTLTLENFRGKKRVRLTEETVIIAGNKKEIKQTDLALEDKVIAMGTMGGNEILDAIRVVVVPKPSATVIENDTLLGIVTSVNAKTSTLKLKANNSDKEIDIKAESKTKIINLSTSKAVQFAGLEENQKIIVVFPKAKEDELPLAKSVYILP
jgi:hypothetical protein